MTHVLCLNCFFQVSPEGGVTVSPDQVIVDGNQSQLELTCTSEAMLGVVFQWRFGGVLLANETSETLVLSNITPSENGGYYECIVANAAGNGSDNATVLFSPVITNNPIHQTAVNGSHSISFNCSAVGYPQPTIHWLKLGGEPLPVSSFISDNGEVSILSIEAPTFGDEGDYLCSASAFNISRTSNTATLHSKSKIILVIIIMPLFLQFLQKGVWRFHQKMKCLPLEIL